MQIRNRLAWKLSAVVLVIAFVVILGTVLLSSLLSRQYALEAARGIMQFNSASIRSGIDELMMGRHDAGMLEFIEEMSRWSTTYQDISLVSHPSGTIAVSRLLDSGTKLELNQKSCKGCHINGDSQTDMLETQDALVTGPNGSRALQVITPIINKPSCRTADCHIHFESGQVLGILQTEYSLARFDDLMNGLSLQQALAAVLAILLATGALLFMFQRLLAKPLRRLVTGIDTLASGDFGFRFSAQRDDEIGLVEDSFNDLADQILAHQRELKRAVEYMEGIVENTADIVITVNNNGFIQTFNQGAEKALGYGRHEVVGQRIEMLFADPKEREAAIAKLQEQENVTNWETRFKAKDDQIRHVLLTLSRLRNRSGEIIGTLGISKDITTEKDLQMELIRSEKEAAIGRAVTHIQHSIKNMLNTLRGGLYVARVGMKKNRQEQIVEGCEMIEEGLSRISGLSLNMLKYAREWTVEAEPTDLSDLIEKIVVATSQTASERGVSIRTEVDGSLPNVPCDPQLIHMCLMDIVSNALDACELKDYDEGEDPEIVIRVYCASDGKRAVLEAQDNAIGMAQEVIDNVFTPFFSTKKKWGTGLGLALTSRIIGLHDGKIVVESEEGEGTVFRITLPFES